MTHKGAARHGMMPKKGSACHGAPTSKNNNSARLRLKDHLVNTDRIARKLHSEYHIERLNERQLSRLILDRLPRDMSPLETIGIAWFLVFSLTKISRRQSTTIDELISIIDDHPLFLEDHTSQTMLVPLLGTVRA